ncbi:hypothetical protein TA3x_005312 [Tundrisphaera sp. TA3]|uniref:hypothetical protein n=1 Tax=Tundrisphaera sp. TA3 TaxID=3435775 RepID=UPI003EBF36E3
MRRKRRWYFTGPFDTVTNMQVVYRLDLEDKKGQHRGAWVRCGSWFGGLFFKPVPLKVILDEVEDTGIYDSL